MSKRDAVLDRLDAQTTVIEVIDGGGTFDDAAAKLGISRRAISKRRATDPDFAERVRAAQLRREQIAAQPRKPVVRAKAVTEPARQSVAATAVGVGQRLVNDADAAPGPTVPDLVDTVWGWACDEGQHPGFRAKCVDVIFRYKLEPLIDAAKTRAQREADREAAELERANAADGDGPLVIALPANGTHAPRRPLVVDAEVVE